MSKLRLVYTSNKGEGFSSVKDIQDAIDARVESEHVALLSGIPQVPIAEELAPLVILEPKSPVTIGDAASDVYWDA